MVGSGFASKRRIVTSEDKYRMIAGLVGFLNNNGLIIHGETLAELLNTNGILTSYGTAYSGGRGVYHLIENAYNYFSNSNDMETAALIAETITNRYGEYAWAKKEGL